jgi:hypothetical protein
VIDTGGPGGSPLVALATAPDAGGSFPVDSIRAAIDRAVIQIAAALAPGHAQQIRAYLESEVLGLAADSRHVRRGRELVRGLDARAWGSSPGDRSRRKREGRNEAGG